MNSNYLISKNKLFFVLALIICIQYSVAHHLGLYGFGVDYRDFYGLKENFFVITKVIDNLGFILATLTINGVHLGVLITSMLYSISNLFLFNTFLKDGKFILLVSVVLCLHTWPIIMGVSNGMRQAIMASFLTFAIIRAHKTDNIPIVYLVLCLLAHNSGLFFSGILFFAVMSSKYLWHSRSIIIFFGICGFLSISYVSSDLIAIGGSRIIGADFRYPFLVLNFSIAIFLFLRTHLSSPQLFLFYANLCAPAILFQGGNYEFERLNQVLILPNIIILSNMLQTRQNILVVTTTLIFFVIMTYATGMFSGLQ